MAAQSPPSVMAHIGRTLSGYRRNWRTFVLIPAVVSVPVNLLLLSPGLDEELSAVAYLSLLQVIMNVALIWAAARLLDGRDRPTIRQAYYDGTAPLVRFLLAAFVLAVITLPAVPGLFLIALGTSPTAAPLLGETLLLALLGLILSFPTLYGLIRLGFAPYAAVADGLTPRAALRASLAATRGRFWRLLLYVFGLIVLLALAALLPMLALFGVAFAGQPALGEALFRILGALILLPLFHLYVFGLYRALTTEEKAPETPVDPAPAA